MTIKIGEFKLRFRSYVFLEYILDLYGNESSITFLRNRKACVSESMEKFLLLIQWTQAIILNKEEAMQEYSWKLIREYLQFVLNIVQSSLDKETVNLVNHYIEHDEYEMAYEGLFIEIIKLEEIPNIDLLKSKKIGELLKLNEETVFDFEFWGKFERYIKANTP